MKTLNIVIPMAGHGSRFEKVGYTLPKPLIDVAGKPMIERVIENMKPAVPHRFIFICQQAHYTAHNLEAVFERAVADAPYEVVLINGVTDGAARTILHAKHLINTDDDLLTANSDQYLTLDANTFIHDARNTENTDGLIMTFNATDEKWSYARTNAEGLVTETAEKVPISQNATVGIYYFRRGSDFVAATEKMIAEEKKHNGEYYVCPVYNELVAKGAAVRIHHIEETKMHGLGTPEDLELFLKKLKVGIVTV